MKAFLKGTILFSLPFLAISAPMTNVFDSASLSGLPTATLPGFSSPLTFTSSANANVTPNTAFTVGTITQTLTNPGPTTEPSTNGYNSGANSTIPIETAIDLSVTYTINGQQYTGDFTGDFVQDGWTKSITSGQYFAYDYAQFNTGTVLNGLEIVPLGKSGYTAQITSSPIIVGKGNPFSVTLVGAPEPSTWAAMGIGLILMVGFGMRRRTAKAVA